MWNFLNPGYRYYGEYLCFLRVETIRIVTHCSEIEERRVCHAEFYVPPYYFISISTGCFDEFLKPFISILGLYVLMG